MHRAYQGVYKYTINNDTISNLMTTKQGVEKKSKNINLLNDINSFQLKITMDRPTDISNPENNTSVIFQYKLIIKTGRDNIEY